MAAIRAIGGIGGAMARKLLHRYSDRGEGPVSEAAAEALSTLEMDEADFSMMAVEEDRYLWGPRCRSRKRCLQGALSIDGMQVIS